MEGVPQSIKLRKLNIRSNRGETHIKYFKSPLLVEEDFYAKIISVFVY